jgi:GntR family transcriptional regulator
MFDQIDPRSPTPLYDQIADRIRVAVAAGELRPGDPLPSVRRLAGSLRVNPATVVQAYRALEAEGFVEMRQGSGTFVLDIGANRRDAERHDQARDLVRDVLADAARLGLSGQDVLRALRLEIGTEAG